MHAEEVKRVARRLKPIPAAVNLFALPNTGKVFRVAVSAVYGGRMLVVEDHQGKFVFPNMLVRPQHRSAVLAAKHAFLKWSGLRDDDLWTAPTTLGVYGDEVETFAFSVELKNGGLRLNGEFGKGYAWWDRKAFADFINSKKHQPSDRHFVASIGTELHCTNMLRAWENWFPINPTLTH